MVQWLRILRAHYRLRRECASPLVCLFGLRHIGVDARATLEKRRIAEISGVRLTWPWVLLPVRLGRPPDNPAEMEALVEQAKDLNDRARAVLNHHLEQSEHPGK